jgi:hypothetical protein
MTANERVMRARAQLDELFSTGASLSTYAEEQRRIGENYERLKAERLTRDAHFKPGNGGINLDRRVPLRPILIDLTWSVMLRDQGLLHAGRSGPPET